MSNLTYLVLGAVVAVTNNLIGRAQQRAKDRQQ